MSETQRWLSNAQMRLALNVVGDLLGHNGQMAVLRLAGLDRYVEQPPPDDARMDIPRGDIVEMFSGIVSMFGEQGARGVLRRWGRTFAARRLERQAALRLRRLGLRLVPVERRARYALDTLLPHVDLARPGHSPLIDDQGEYFVIELKDCLYCQGKNVSHPTCPAVIGLLEGVLRWATGSDYDVVEDAASDPDAHPFRIRKRPLSRR
jgi:predicted hydrocarbon binding protein